MIDHALHSSLAGPSGPSGPHGPDGHSGPSALTGLTGLPGLTGLTALSEPTMAIKIASAMQRDGAGGLSRLYADAACILHAAGLSDQIGVALNRIGPAEFDIYATSLAKATK